MAIKLISVFLLLQIYSLNASVQYDHELNTNSSFSWNIENGVDNFEEALFQEEELLKNFTPDGVRVLNKIVIGREFELYIEKKIFGFAKRFTIKGNIQVEKLQKSCAENENAYRAFFDFGQSGADVTEAVAAFSLDICSSLKSPSLMAIKTKNALFYRGKKYGMITEPIAKSVLNDQVSSFIVSIKSTAKNIK